MTMALADVSPLRVFKVLTLALVGASADEVTE